MFHICCDNIFRRQIGQQKASATACWRLKSSTQLSPPVLPLSPDACAVEICKLGPSRTHPWEASFPLEAAGGPGRSWQVRRCMSVLAGQRHISRRGGILQRADMQHTIASTTWQHSGATEEAV